MEELIKQTKTGIHRDVYLHMVLGQTPRLLGLMDRNMGSKTYGCFDRQYWHYAVSDFPCAECQESVLTMAHLYSIEHKDNPYYRNELFLEWINSGLLFWAKIQNRDGSFSEWYPYEKSMSVTPFSVYAVSETLLVLKDKVKDRKTIVDSLVNAAKWLVGNKDLRATNHYTGSIAALYNLYLITKNDAYAIEARRIVSELAKMQSKEGWFMEYNGADIGYSSIALYYLTDYQSKSKDPNVSLLIEKVVDFISYFVHPDGTFGGEYGSRNTEYIIPRGFELLSDSMAKAEMIAGEIRNSLINKKHVSLCSFDDRYLTYLSYMYIQSFIDGRPVIEIQDMPIYLQSFVKDFSEAGLKVISNENFYCVLSAKKGGAYKLDFKKNRESSFFDAGILIEDNGGNYFYSFYFDKKSEVNFANNRFTAARKMVKVPSNVLTPYKNILQRLFLITIGRFAFVERKTKDVLRNILITNIKMSGFGYERSIEIKKDEVIVSDMINHSENLKRIFAGVKGSYIYGPSTRYFQAPSLGCRYTLIDSEEMRRYAGYRHVKVIRSFDYKGIMQSCHIETK